MSIATDLQGVYTNLNAELTAINTALADKGQTAASTIHDVGTKIGGIVKGNPKFSYILSGRGGSFGLSEDDFVDAAGNYIYSIRGYALHKTGITSAIIPDHVTDIGGWAFAYTDITYVKLSESSYFSELSDGTFYDCRQLSSITIPSNITKIGMYALGIGGYAGNKATITMLSVTPPTVDSLALGHPSLERTNIEKIIVPYSSDHSVLAAYQNATNWAAFASILEEAPAPTEEV